MIFSQKGQRLRHYLLLFCLSLFFVPNNTFAQWGIKLPKPPRTVDLFEEQAFGLENYSVDSTFFALKPSAYKRSVKLDSTGTYITIDETLDDRTAGVGW